MLTDSFFDATVTPLSKTGPFLFDDAASVGSGGVDSWGVLQASLGDLGEESEKGGAGVV